MAKQDQFSLISLQHALGKILLSSVKALNKPKTIDKHNEKKKRLFQQQCLAFMTRIEKEGLQQCLPDLLYNVRGGTNAAPTGVGKTFTMIMLAAQNLLDSELCTRLKQTAEYNAEKLHYIPVNVVVCPVAIQSHWLAELKDAWPEASTFEYVPPEKKDTHLVLRNGNFFKNVAKDSTTEMQYLEQLPANSFVIITWDHIFKEYNFTVTAETIKMKTRAALQPTNRGVLFSLSNYLFGRVIVDEGQLAGKKTTHRFKMAIKLHSLFRWFQTATPIMPHREREDLQRMSEFLHLQPYLSMHKKWRQLVDDRKYDDLVQYLKHFMWTHTHAQVSCQLALPPIIKVDEVLTLSPVEYDYYNSTMHRSDVNAQEFCNVSYQVSSIMFALGVVDAASEDVHKSHYTLIDQMLSNGLLLLSKLLKRTQKEMTFEETVICTDVDRILSLTLEECLKKASHIMLTYTSEVYCKKTAIAVVALTLLYTTQLSLRLSEKTKVGLYTIEDLKKIQNQNAALFQTVNQKWIRENNRREHAEYTLDNFVMLSKECGKYAPKTLSQMFAISKALNELSGEQENAFDDLTTQNLTFARIVKDDNNNSAFVNLRKSLASIHSVYNEKKTLRCNLFDAIDASRKAAEILRKPIADAFVTMDFLCDYYRVKNGTHTELTQKRLLLHYKNDNVKRAQDWMRVRTDKKYCKILTDYSVTESNCEELYHKVNSDYNMLTNTISCLEALGQYVTMSRSSEKILTMETLAIDTICILSQNGKTDFPYYDKTQLFQAQANYDGKLERFSLLAKCIFKPKFCCALCNQMFSQQRLPLQFNVCRHNICSSCVLKTDHACPHRNLGENHLNCKVVFVREENEKHCDVCDKYFKDNDTTLTFWKCGAHRCEECSWNVKNKCGACGDISPRQFRQLHKLPPELKLSESMVHTFELIQSNECTRPLNLKMTKKYQLQPAAIHCSSTKLKAIAKKITDMISDVSLQADGSHVRTHASNSLRKILVFDADCLLRFQLYNKLQRKCRDRFENFLLDKDTTIIEKFIASTSSAVLILDLKTSAGMHLVVADVVILCSPCDDPTQTLQAQGRAHRFGQTKPVSIIQFYISNTIEEVVYNASQVKMQAFSDSIVHEKECKDNCKNSDDDCMSKTHTSMDLKSLGNNQKQAATTDWSDGDSIPKKEVIDSHNNNNIGTNIKASTLSAFKDSSGVPRDMQDNSVVDSRFDVCLSSSDTETDTEQNDARISFNFKSTHSQNTMQEHKSPLKRSRVLSFPEPSEVDRMLCNENVNMGSFGIAFKEAGFEKLIDCFGISSEDFRSMNIPRNRVGRIINYLLSHEVKPGKEFL